MPATEQQAEEIRNFYQHGKGSIQDYARMYHLTVQEVCAIVGEEDLLSVEIGGDLVDPQEMGKAGLSEIRGPQEHDVPFSLN